MIRFLFIGNAKVAGIVTDLKLVGLQYNTAASMFFISYILFQIPCNLLMKQVFKPASWRAYILLLCELSSLLDHSCTDYGSLGNYHE
jgi:hypothetical protein